MVSISPEYKVYLFVSLKCAVDHYFDHYHHPTSNHQDVTAFEIYVTEKASRSYHIIHSSVLL